MFLDLFRKFKLNLDEFRCIAIFRLIKTFRLLCLKCLAKWQHDGARHNDYLDEDVPDNDDPALPALDPPLSAIPSKSSTIPSLQPRLRLRVCGVGTLIVSQAAWEICQKMYTSTKGFNIMGNENSHSIVHGGDDIAEYADVIDMSCETRENVH